MAHEACFQVTTAVAWFEGQFLLCLLEAKRAAVTVSEFDSRRSHSCSSFPAPSAPSALCDLKPPSVSHTVACFLLKMHCAPVQGFHVYFTERLGRNVSQKKTTHNACRYCVWFELTKYITYFNGCRAIYSHHSPTQTPCCNFSDSKLKYLNDIFLK